MRRKSCRCGTDDLPVGPGGGWGRRSEQTVNKRINGELPENGARTPQILPVGYRARQSAPAEGVVTLPCLTCQAHGPGSSSETVGAPPPHRLWTRSSLHLKTLFSQIPTYPPPAPAATGPERHTPRDILPEHLVKTATSPSTLSPFLA